MSKDRPAHILKHFMYSNLPEKLQDLGEQFFMLADRMDNNLPECAEKSAGLRKLLEARDCMMRSLREGD